MQQNSDGTTEFTFELEGNEHQKDDSAPEDMKATICSDVKGFVEAMWDVYQRDGE